MQRRSDFVKDFLKRLIVIIFILLLLWTFFTFYYSYKNCENESCFYKYMKDCKRAKFISVGNMTFEYKINGKEQNQCFVHVRLLQGDLNQYDSLKLVGKTMDCYLPLGVIIKPEYNLDFCHGLLKEGLQDLVLKKLYAYIIQNLGRIRTDLSNF
ncbi:MAG: hypothetical protein ACOYT4_04070 [Nanoarchaeota archaeon]